MDLLEFSTEESKFGIALPIYGAGWLSSLEKIIPVKISPDKLERLNKEITLNYSQVDFEMEKDGIQFVLELNKFDDISMILLSDDTNENKQKLRDWATIIAEEVEKLKK